MTDKMKVNEERHQLVVKSNDLVRGTNELVKEATSDLSVSEMKLLHYLISKVDSVNDKNFDFIEFSVIEYADVIGMNYSGKNYTDVKKNIMDLKRRAYWVTSPDNPFEEFTFAWIDYAKINKGNGVIKVKLHSTLKEYLLNIKKNFTQYELDEVLALDKKYTFRLFEILLSHSHNYKKHTYSISISELRELLGVEDSYEQYRDFRKYVLEAAVDEINSFTSMNVSFETERKGKYASAIKFHIEQKSKMNEIRAAAANRRERLNKK